MPGVGWELCVYLHRFRRKLRIRIIDRIYEKLSGTRYQGLVVRSAAGHAYTYRRFPEDRVAGIHAAIQRARERLGPGAG